MFKRTLERGFTLIELLVVIAIIGILAATVLASLGSARQGGADASVQSSVNSAKAQAEIFFTSSSTYNTVCATAASGNGLGALLTAIDNNSAPAGTPVIDGAVQTATTINCNDVAGSWALSSPLVTGGYFCADSTGFSGKRVTPLVVFNAATAATNPLGGGTQCPTS